MNFIDIPEFINTHITGRRESLLLPDMTSHHSELEQGIKGKSVLVIGGAGTIGLSFIKALLPFEPGRLYVVDTNENGLTELTRDLRSTHGQFIPEQYKTYPMNFGDEVFKKLFVQEGPFQIVANFAAHKHVRSEKDHYAIQAMIENNVFKTRNLLDLLSGHKPEHFFCVSTDKAVNPVNVMGASKKLMEEVIMAYSSDFSITTARFANVAFSNGSLLDGYIQRILKRQPLSCPNDVLRFFVSPEESGQICLLACLLGQSGDIYFPKLSDKDMINFKNITIQFLKELGKEALECKTEMEAKEFAYSMKDDRVYPVYFFSSETSGEKLFEEFYSEADTFDLKRYSGLGVIHNIPKYGKEEIDQCVIRLKAIMEDPDSDKAAIIACIGEILPDFSHVEKDLNLDQKM